jgi:hypothetical protein
VNAPFRKVNRLVLVYIFSSRAKEEKSPSYCSVALDGRVLLVLLYESGINCRNSKLKVPNSFPTPSQLLPDSFSTRSHPLLICVAPTRKGILQVFRMFVLPFVLHFDSLQFLGWMDSFSLHVHATQINRGWERVGNRLGTSWEPLVLSYDN